MNDSRPNNFGQADEALAIMLKNNPSHSLYQDMISQGYEISSSGVSDYREDNNLTWHEENNMKSMDLMSSDINKKLGHLGGVGEINNRNKGKEYTNEGIEEDQLKQQKC